MKIHILGRNALNCALYLEFNDYLYNYYCNKFYISNYNNLCKKVRTLKKVIL